MHAMGKDSSDTAHLVAEVLKAIGFKAPDGEHLTVDEKFHQQVSELKRPAAAIPTELIKNVRSPNTGATFDMVVCRGIATDLPNYTYPEGVEKHQTEGGLVPNGQSIKDVHGQYTTEYKQWRWDEFWKADLNFFVGKPVPSYVRPPVAKAA